MRMSRYGIKYILIGCVLSSLVWIIIIVMLTGHGEHFTPKSSRMQIVRLEGPYRVTPPALPSHHDEITALGMIHNEREIAIRDEGFKRYAFNLLISNRIGKRRKLPDTRDSKCPDFGTGLKADTPPVSVIICFHNEAFSALARTVQSILDRTPKYLLREIILLDDFSSNDDIKMNINQFVMENSKTIKLIHTGKREGLIRGRLKGAKAASGSILVFLDSHCEVNNQWLEPLVKRILEDRRHVVCPVIDIISADTFEYSKSPLVRGGFNWGLHFTWEALPDDQALHLDGVQPVRSPTMAGGLFAIERNYFFELGAYDEGMEIWGGENLEISFRIWMCGGTLEILPCSRVGHLFRHHRPYGNAGKGDTMGKNSVRVAEVWLGPFKRHFYDVRPDLKNIKKGDLSKRLQLKARLQCKSFDWYLDEVYPELGVPLKRSGRPLQNMQGQKKREEVLMSGKIVNRKTMKCLDSMGSANEKRAQVINKRCNKSRIQYWVLMEGSELRAEGILCLDVLESRKKRQPKMMKCHGEKSGQEWKYYKTTEQLYNPATGMCLAAQQGEVLLQICAYVDAQKWKFNEE